MNERKVAMELVRIARDLAGAAKRDEFGNLKPGTPFMHNGKTYWKASRTRAVPQRNMVRIRPDEVVEVIR